MSETPLAVAMWRARTTPRVTRERLEIIAEDFKRERDLAALRESQLRETIASLESENARQHQKIADLIRSLNQSTVLPDGKLPRGAITIAQIKSCVATKGEITLNELLAHHRRQEVVRLRQCAMYLCRKLTVHSNPKIGLEFAGRDHTTVMHSVNKIETLRPTNAELNHFLTECERELRNGAERDAASLEPGVLTSSTRVPPTEAPGSSPLNEGYAS